MSLRPSSCAQIACVRQCRRQCPSRLMPSTPSTRIDRISRHLSASKRVAAAITASSASMAHHDSRPPITSHALDTSIGKPARGLPLVLELLGEGGVWQTLGRTATNEDGRAPALMASVSVLCRFPTLHNAEVSEAGFPVVGRVACPKIDRGEQEFVKGTYRVTFDTEAYFRLTGAPCFYPEVAVVFRAENPSEHFHIPLLISPFGYSTYRGS